MKDNLEELEKELQRFPDSVLDGFRRTKEEMREKLPEADLLAWARQGVAIAQQPVRSWEAASEYFRVSPQVLEHLTLMQLMDWAQCGSGLCHDSPTLAIAYFRASPGTVSYLRGRRINGWADMGRSFYKGTWKSSALSARFFEATPSLVEHLSYPDLERFVGLVETLSHKSAELASDCLRLGQEEFPRLEGESNALIGLGLALAETGWREVKGSFEAVAKLHANLSREHQGRFLRLAERLAREGMSNIPTFMNEGVRGAGQGGRREPELPAGVGGEPSSSLPGGGGGLLAQQPRHPQPDQRSSAHRLV